MTVLVAARLRAGLEAWGMEVATAVVLIEIGPGGGGAGLDGGIDAGREGGEEFLIVIRP
jgi:hypothetical protein